MAADSSNGVSRLNRELHALNNWKAELFCSDIIGYENPVDLFQFTDRSRYKATRCKPTNKTQTHPIVFDSSKFPPTKEGLNKLLCHLKKLGMAHGMNLISRSSSGVLSCYRCRTFIRNSRSLCF